MAASVVFAVMAFYGHVRMMTLKRIWEMHHLQKCQRPGREALVFLVQMADYNWFKVSASTIGF
jgi:hypothetical protein